MKPIKRLLINLEGFYDFFRSRYAGSRRLILPPLLGAAGAAIGVAAAIVFDLTQDQSHKDGINFSPVVVVTSFPDSCDIKGPFNIIARGPGNKSTIYYGSNGKYVPATLEENIELAEKMTDCLDNALFNRSLRQKFVAYSGFEISEPLRSELNSDSKQDNYRLVQSRAQEKIIEDKALNMTYVHFYSPLRGIMEGKVFDHLSNPYVKHYKPEETKPSLAVPATSGAILFSLAGLFCLFGNRPDERAINRQEDREKRRRALDADFLL